MFPKRTQLSGRDAYTPMSAESRSKSPAVKRVLIWHKLHNNVLECLITSDTRIHVHVWQGVIRQWRSPRVIAIGTGIVHIFKCLPYSLQCTDCCKKWQLKRPLNRETNGKVSTQRTRGRASWCNRSSATSWAHQAHSFLRPSYAFDKQRTWQLWRPEPVQWRPGRHKLQRHNHTTNNS